MSRICVYIRGQVPGVPGGKNVYLKKGVPGSEKSLSNKVNFLGRVPLYNHIWLGYYFYELCALSKV